MTRILDEVIKVVDEDLSVEDPMSTEAATLPHIKDWNRFVTSVVGRLLPFLQWQLPTQQLPEVARV